MLQKPSLTFSIAAFLGTGVNLGLAIIGWGGPRAFFSHAPLTVLTIVTVLLTLASIFSGGNLSEGVREDRSNRWVIVAFAVIGLLLGWLPALTDRIGWGVIDGDAMRWLGVAVYTGGGVLRLWPVFVLSHRFSGLVAIQPNHQLVTDGIYRWVRHPSYLGLLVASLGWALAFRSLVGVALALATCVPLVARMKAEEALLASEFGRDYEAYRSRTARLIPGVY